MLRVRQLPSASATRSGSGGGTLTGATSDFRIFTPDKVFLSIPPFRVSLQEFFSFFIVARASPLSFHCCSYRPCRKQSSKFAPAPAAPLAPTPLQLADKHSFTSTMIDAFQANAVLRKWWRAMRLGAGAERSPTLSEGGRVLPPPRPSFSSTWTESWQWAANFQERWQGFLLQQLESMEADLVAMHDALARALSLPDIAATGGQYAPGEIARDGAKKHSVATTAGEATNKDGARGTKTAEDRRSLPRDSSPDAPWRRAGVRDIELHTLLLPCAPDLSLAMNGERASKQQPTAPVVEEDRDSTSNQDGAAGPTTDGHSFTLMMDIIERVSASTPQLVAFSNLLLAAAYLLLVITADAFLGAGVPTDRPAGQAGIPVGASDLHVNDRAGRRQHGRQRFGGFLFFKLLLVSAVLEPSAPDFLLLLAWYSFLSLLRSLAHLAGVRAKVAAHGELSPPGARWLLALVPAAAASAGVGAGRAVLRRVEGAVGLHMATLLTSDCVLLLFDALTHGIAARAALVEEGHRAAAAALEARRAELREESQGSGWPGISREEEELSRLDAYGTVGEAAHARRLAQLDAATHALEVISLLLKAAHFLHVWVLNGGISLVNGVLLLHLHSTVSLLTKKVSFLASWAESNRNMHCEFACAGCLKLIASCVLKGCYIFTVEGASRRFLQPVSRQVILFHP